MSDTVVLTQTPSKAKVFFRRLITTVILWTVVHRGFMLSGNALVSDGIFILLSSSSSRWPDSRNFTAWPKNAASPVSNGAGCFGGALLTVGTFLNVTGHLGTSNGSPARVNDFETGFMILFVLGLCVRQFAVESQHDGNRGDRHDAFRFDVCAVAAEFHPENQFFPRTRRRRKIFRPLFHPHHKIQRHGRVSHRLAHRQAQDDPAHQSRQNVGRFRRRDFSFNGCEPRLRPFFRRQNGRHELDSRRHARRCFEFHRRRRRFD
jgi:hypothetical protein